MKHWIYILLFSFTGSLQAQTILKPGFDAKEYREMLQLFTQHYSNYPDTTKQKGALNSLIPSPQRYSLVYRSPQVGLKNCWDFWLRKDAPVGVISIRGTIPDVESWTQNFYSAMVPANGSLQLNDSTNFDYSLASNPEAMVHVGWLLGMSSLAPSIMDQIKLNYGKGIKEYIIIGHSQGAAISFLLRTYLHYQIQNKALPADIRFKTYCSAAPKPGNAYYAYEFENITRGGWGLTVINSLDWVPETPFSVQTLADISKINPFGNIKQAWKGQPFYIRWVINSKFNQINRSTRKAQKSFEKNLGGLVFKQVKRFIPQFKEPKYTNSNNYQRAGEPIVFIPGEAYSKTFPDTADNVFQHHMQDRYYILSQSYNTVK